MRHLVALGGLLACLAGGYGLRHYLGVPVSAPVLGLALLFAALCMLGRVPEALRRIADILLRGMLLAFVPAAVGLITLKPLLQEAGVGLAAALIVSTAAALWVTAWVFARLAR